ncbi:MAG TPA: DASS family sodium-coupled anion symporter [Parafilimonas sp.]|nr:DASS family sodium-coupled anion symporter [Parafilimonas sp.]
MANILRAIKRRRKYLQKKREKSLLRRNVYNLIKISVFALIAVFLLNLTHLPIETRNALFLLILATGLWVTEAIPPFAVSLLIMGFAVAFIADTKNEGHWQQYVNTWASPTIWLFMGGFFLAQGAANTGLDKLFARKVFKRFGEKPGQVLFSVMLITLILSLFMSNTATAALMLMTIAPLTEKLGKNDPFSKALVLGVAITAVIGGMGTIISTPANLIAAGVIESKGLKMGFSEWLYFGLPLCIGLVYFLWIFLKHAYPSDRESVDIEALLAESDAASLNDETILRRSVAIITTIVTIVLWVCSSYINIPLAVVSFVPIVIFTATGIIVTADIPKLPWDTLILVAGSLTLGIAVTNTGLADYFVKGINFGSASILAIFIVLAYISSIVSNFMSTTAAASILIPIGATLLPEHTIAICTLIALSVSTAAILPISTPPNAMAYGTGVLHASDFRRVGFLLGGITPLLIAVLMFIMF